MLSPDEQLLRDFFEAARLYDTAVMARLSAAPMNPRVDGIVDSFEIVESARNGDGSERVEVTARVRTFDGRVESRRLLFTITRDEGRWFIREWTAITAVPVTRLPASRTLREASSDPPRRTGR